MKIIIHSLVCPFTTMVIDHYTYCQVLTYGFHIKHWVIMTGTAYLQMCMPENSFNIHNICMNKFISIYHTWLKWWRIVNGVKLCMNSCLQICIISIYTFIHTHWPCKKLYNVMIRTKMQHCLGTRSFLFHWRYALSIMRKFMYIKNVFWWCS